MVVYTPMVMLYVSILELVHSTTTDLKTITIRAANAFRSVQPITSNKNQYLLHDVVISYDALKG